MTHDTPIADRGAPSRYRQRAYQYYVSAFKGHVDSATLATQFERHARFLDHLLGPFVSGRQARKILDVACGHGRVLYWAQRRGLNACGFDISAEQIAIARSLDLKADVASASEYLAQCDRDFDLITAFDIVEHFTRDEALTFLEQCRACLRPGGGLALTTPNGAAWRPGPVVYGDLTHETIFAPGAIRHALTLSGFDRITVREIGPAPISAAGRVRQVLWRMLRLWPALLDFVEKGSTDGVYSRVMLVTAHRPI